MMGLETDRNSVSVTVFWPKPPKNMVSVTAKTSGQIAVSAET